MENWIKEERLKLSSALEISYIKAEAICRRLVERLEARSGDIDAINEFRGRLVMILVDTHRADDDPEPILEELDKLFAGFLTASDKKSAAETLVWKFEFLENRNWRVAFETAYKLIELFGESGDADVLDQVEKGYGFLFEKLPGEDDRFAPLCSSYGKFLERESIRADFACQVICEIEESLDGNMNHVAIPMIQSFLASRSEHLTEDEQQKLRSRLAANFLYVGRFKEAITECSLLMVDSDRASLPDYMLWCGEAFLELECFSIAAMYFREIVQISTEEGFERSLQGAQALLKRIPEEKLH